MLHITNGDEFVARLRSANLPGKLLAWKDVLYEGPVFANLSLEELSEFRVKYIAECRWEEYEKIRISFNKRNEILKRYRDYQEIVLWFEHDLDDQLQLIQILHWFSGKDLSRTTLSLIWTDESFGTFNRSEIMALFRNRSPVGKEQLELAREAWRAFGSPNPYAIEEMVRKDTAVLPFLTGALYRHLEQFPSLANGLSRSEREILRLVLLGIQNPQELFVAYNRREERRFLDETVFWTYLMRLINTKHPLLKLTEGNSFRLPSRFLNIKKFQQQMIIITQLGMRVLIRRMDWIKMNGVDKWLGGVHLKRGNIWRWDEKNHHIVKTPS